MNLKNKLLKSVSKKILKKNEIFKNKELGKKCFIFGNGNSLKYYDFSKFKFDTTIGCNSLFFHNDFNKLDCKYYFIPAPYIFSPIRKFYNKYYINYLSNLYKNKIQLNNKTNFFLNLSDIIFIRGKNIYYSYHFNSKNSHDLSQEFSYLDSSLSAMMGLAIFLGFKEVTLVGCDYLFNPYINGHFFEKGKGEIIKNKINLPEFINKNFSNKVKINVMAPKGFDTYFNTIYYEDFFNSNLYWRDNNYLIKNDILSKLNKLFYKT